MITIGKDTFNVPQPRGMRSFALQQKLIPIAGRIANVFLHFAGVGDIAKLMDEDVLKVLPKALPHLGQLFSEMPADEIETIARTLLGDPRTGATAVEVATINKMPLFGGAAGDLFDGMMQGRTIDTWKLLWHAIGVWYPDFLSLARVRIAEKAAASLSQESNTSDTSGHASA